MRLVLGVRSVERIWGREGERRGCKVSIRSRLPNLFSDTGESGYGTNVRLCWDRRGGKEVSEVV